MGKDFGAYYCPYIPLSMLRIVKEEHKVGDKLHRTDGPAITLHDNTNEWWLNGAEYTFDAWCEKLFKTEKEKARLLLIWA